MKLDLFQVDSFTRETFKGNPACVVPLDFWLSDDVLMNIAKENAVAETAFFIIEKDHVHLKWFTPEIEMDLCGHATLAAAHVLKTCLHYPEKDILFKTLSGDLLVSELDGLYTLDFPSRKPVLSELPEIIKKALNIQPAIVLKSRDYVLIYNSEKEVRDIQIDRRLFDQINLDPGGVVVTAKGDVYDFVSRYFTSQSSILEDPVTGSSHCSLIPYWAERLQKNEMKAIQLSDRTGELYCVDKGDRVLISGYAKTYAIGVLWTE
ncbi:PhzF family phenazine biosynthesis protein [Mucilaginibacter sp. RB4R14]|uniref:PhzF family phenazine biosynthesis protein n=1 Tax=Mucilaginibacter aurantiaciroseus TaxID=2949308 RepID=UPI0020919A16|nr:PhzF family phenazine biosynthesis protein [Mucilaginibacter aurantiaciroseus]MCO5933937.1 PhzF family phenazine biosynthesis protein [Mucilaginibacter aurantiaciroseus]